MSPSRRAFLRAGAVATGILAAGPLRALEAVAAARAWLPVKWVDIPDPDHRNAGHNPSEVFEQGEWGGGATFGRLEGCCWVPGRWGGAWIVSTDGGNAGLVSVSPRGAVILREDHDDSDRIKALPGGRVIDLARNDANHGEFAGCTRSPDGRWLFVNIQRPGATYAPPAPGEERI